MRGGWEKGGKGGVGGKMKNGAEGFSLLDYVFADFLPVSLLVCVQFFINSGTNKFSD